VAVGDDDLPTGPQCRSSPSRAGVTGTDDSDGGLAVDGKIFRSHAGYLLSVSKEAIDSGVADVVVEQSEGQVDADPVDGFRFRPSAASATATTVESTPATPEPKIIAGTSRGSCAGR
jgi:hypothetical protein